MDPGKVAASNRERMLYQMNPRATSGYTDESLELPPLMTGVPPVLQSARQGYTDTIMVDSQGGSSIPSSQPPLHTPAQSGGPSTAHAHIQDMQMSASTLMPTLPAGSKDTQASGFRAMIMSISHLKKLEVLRRICPPKPLSPKRGPIIAIEGHNAALRVAVGRAVEKALVQSGVCNVIARTAMNLDGKHSNVASGCESKLQKSLAQDSLAFDVSAIFECMVLVSQVQKASSAIMQHVTSATSHLVPRSSARPASPTPAGPPPPLPATSTSPKPTDCSPTSLSPTIHVATLSEIDGVSEAVPATVSLHSTPPPLPPSPLLPVALLTTGFSLAVADKCAVSVDIDDSFGPVDHWEYMATMWRGTPGPDLVVYADASPPPSAAKGGSRPTVHTVEQEGVLVVHVPLADSGGENNADSRDGGIDADHGGVVIDQKTERRLAFEVMEFVRSGKFGVAVSEK
ncbi:slightly ste11-like protein [Sporothrix curviconia]|uniref:Slightly ste11-like protein n=1 Tax=Sporothrix curviconia TaxID=1260050 RepID=A0ABP0AQE9_9PEZI